MNLPNMAIDFAECDGSWMWIESNGLKSLGLKSWHTFSLSFGHEDSEK